MSGQPGDAGGQLAGQYRTMLLIRRFLERCRDLHDRGEIRGSIHLGIGQEAVPAGVCGALRVSDTITTTYRGHGHVLAKGTPVARVLAEMCGRSDGCCGGLGGSLHLADASVRNLGANAIVGAGVPIAIGAALAAQMSGADDVAVTFFGDGAINQGVVMESLNLAAVWRLPLLFACENNQFSEMTRATDMVGGPSIGGRAEAFGMRVDRVDGMDVGAVAAFATEAVARLRSGDGPAFVEFETYRFSGHYHGDPETIRSSEEIEAWRARDPIVQASDRLRKLGSTSEDLGAIERSVDEELAAAEQFALASPRPQFSAIATLIGPASTGPGTRKGEDRWHA